MTAMDRRTALMIAGALLFAPRVRAAETHKALFWTVTPTGRKSAIVFGYVRIGAALVPDIVRDGDAMVDASERIVIDMPQAVHFPTVGMPRTEVRPILRVVAPATAERLRRALAATPAATTMDRLGGVETTMFLMGEGQANSAGTAGGSIFDHARSVGKPVDQLLSEADMLAAFHPPDMAAVNLGITDATIVALLDLRDRVGPIGAYLERLYRERNSDEIIRVTSDLDRHGVFSPSRLLQNDQIRDAMVARATDFLTRQADAQRFMLFPLGLLAQPDGLLASFKAKGMTVEPRA